jgi:hypothetical protein
MTNARGTPIQDAWQPNGRSRTWILLALVAILGLGSSCGSSPSSKYGVKLGSISARVGGQRAQVSKVSAGAFKCLFVNGRVVVVQSDIVLKVLTKHAPIIVPGAKTDDVTYYCDTDPKRNHSAS